MDKHRIKVVAFDVDGVLLDCKFPALLPKHLKLDPARIAPFFRGPFKKCVLGTADLVEELAPYLHDWGWGGTVSEFLEFWFETDSTINETAMRFVEALTSNGITCIIASTQEAHRAKYLDTQLRFSEIFSDVFYSCRVGLEKPDARFFIHLQNAVKAEPAEILFLDDQARNIDGAQLAGWNAELYTIDEDLANIGTRYGVPWN